MKFDKKFTLMELVGHKIKKQFIPLMSKRNCSKLNNTDFTIISNNCWGGVFVMSILDFPKTVLRLEHISMQKITLS